METRAGDEQLEKIGAVAAGMINPGDRVGLGSGKAALAFVQMLGRRVREEKLKIIGVPTSLLTEKTAREHGVPLGTLAEVEQLHIAVDGADEVDPMLNLLKGGGGNLLREKVIAGVARRLVIVVGEEKLVGRLGERFPVFVEVIEFARPAITRTLTAMGAAVEPRKNADGSLFATDNGNPLLHCRFPEARMGNPAALDTALRRIYGVVETGLFVGMAAEVLVAHLDGTIERKVRK